MPDDFEISIAIRCDDEIVKRIDRPVRWSQDGRPVVCFRKEYHVVSQDRSIEVCSHKETIPRDEVTFERPKEVTGDPAPDPDDSCSKFPRAGDWTEEQLHIIQQPASARLVVEAPPGSGKTAVACARAAWLLNQGLNPGSIWMISFTRTAVKELRDRITCLLNDNVLLTGVWIATLDSNAWYLRTGFVEDGGILPGSYNESIEKTIELLEGGNQGLLEHLESVEHIVVDEAQDLVTMRAQLIEALFRSVGESTGLTVFTDPAQAIYGFTEDEETDTEGGLARRPLPERLRSDADLGFDSLELHAIHRTGDDHVRDLVNDLRSIALDGSRSSTEQYAEVRKRIESFGGQKALDPRKLAETLESGPADTLVLFRTRADVLRASAYLAETALPHRLRLSNRCSVIHPWLGILFWDFCEAWLAEDDFASRWLSRLPLPLPGLSDRLGAWALLRQTAGDRSGRVDMRRLRERLYREKPPIEFVTSEYGFDGPILSTIHASKGREAKRVLLFLPRPREDDEECDSDWREEARVLVVGATRQREELNIGLGFRFAGMSLETSNGPGRAFKASVRHSRNWVGASVELGICYDLAEGSPVCASYQSSDEALAAQKRLMASATAGLLSAITRAPGKGDWTRRVFLVSDTGEEQGCVGVLSAQVDGDLFRIGHFVAERAREVRGMRRSRLKPSLMIDRVSVFGAGTGVLPPDHHMLGELHSPWRESGFFLAPLISTYPMVFYNRY